MGSMIYFTFPTVQQQSYGENQYEMRFNKAVEETHPAPGSSLLWYTRRGASVEDHLLLLLKG